MQEDGKAKWDVAVYSDTQAEYLAVLEWCDYWYAHFQKDMLGFVNPHWNRHAIKYASRCVEVMGQYNKATNNQKTFS